MSLPTKEDIAVGLLQWYIETEDAYQEYLRLSKISQAIMEHLIEGGENRIIENDKIFYPVIKHVTDEKLRLTREIFKKPVF